jgi:hypothetical protein
MRCSAPSETIAPLLGISRLCRALEVALAIALLAGGCGDEPDPGSPREPDSGSLEVPDSAGVVRWVGAVEETDVRVAVLAGRGKARLYFSGGAESYATATRWFNVEYDGGEHIEFEEDSWRIHAHLTLGGLIAEVQLGDDVTRKLNAAEVEPGTLAGLYEGKADCGRLGLIVTQAAKDTRPTAQGACTNTTGKSLQRVDPIAPITSERGKIRVLTPGGSGDETLLLQAAALEPL